MRKFKKLSGKEVECGTHFKTRKKSGWWDNTKAYRIS